MRQLKNKHITNNESDSLRKYYKEIALEKLVTPEEEANLARRIKLGDEKAIEQLIKANLRFVISIAKQYQNSGLPLIDLINEGNIGLIKAAKRFDETRGFRFISYAVWWIRRSLQQSLDDKSRLVRLPFHRTSKFNKIRKAIMKMEHEIQREPSYEEIGEEICLSAKMIEEVIKTSTKVVSLETQLTDVDNLTLMDVIEDKDCESAEQQFTNKTLKQEIEKVISTLPANEASILRLHFGLNDKEPLTLEEIGNQFGFVSTRVRHIKEKALFTLKNTSRYGYLREYL